MGKDTMELSEVIKQIKPCDLDKPYVFISYSAQDRDLVWRDVLEFQKRGYNVWLDEKNLDKTKASWTEDALSAIEDFCCELLVFYVSKSSLISENCYRELAKTTDEDSVQYHNGPVKFIAIDVEEIGNIVAFKDEMHRTIIQDESIPKEQRKKMVKTLQSFFKQFFDTNNERVRIRPKNEENRKIDYYEDILVQFPKATFDETLVVAPVEEMPVDEVTVKEAPVEEVHVEETLAEETPVEVPSAVQKEDDSAALEEKRKKNALKRRKEMGAKAQKMMDDEIIKPDMAEAEAAARFSADFDKKIKSGTTDPIKALTEIQAENYEVMRIIDTHKTKSEVEALLQLYEDPEIIADEAKLDQLDVDIFSAYKHLKKLYNEYIILGAYDRIIKKELEAYKRKQEEAQEESKEETIEKSIQESENVQDSIDSKTYPTLYEALVASKCSLPKTRDDEGKKVDDVKLIHQYYECDLPQNEAIYFANYSLATGCKTEYEIAWTEEGMIKCKGFLGGKDYLLVVVTEKHIVCFSTYSNKCVKYNIDVSQIESVDGTYYNNKLFGVKDSQIRIKLKDQKYLWIDQYFSYERDFNKFLKPFTDLFERNK